MTRKLYQLDTELKNPSPDRRFRDWDKRPCFPAGLYMLTQRGGYQEVFKVDLEGGLHGGLHPSDDGFQVLLEEAREIEPDPRNLRHKLATDERCFYAHNMFEVLQQLLDSGDVTPEQVEAACSKVEAGWEE